MLGPSIEGRPVEKLLEQGSGGEEVPGDLRGGDPSSYVHHAVDGEAKFIFQFLEYIVVEGSLVEALFGAGSTLLTMHP